MEMMMEMKKEKKMEKNIEKKIEKKSEKKDVILQIEDPQMSSPPTSSDNAVLHRLWAEIGNRSSKQYNYGEEITKIQKVPWVIFKHMKFDEDYFMPREMSIGPLYAEGGNPELKLKLAAQFIRTSGKTYTALLESIEKEIETLRTCFHIELFDEYWNDDRMALMLFLDGCSVLQFIYSRAMNELKYLQINNFQASLIEQDLFLMSNQIPFRVLEILMDSLSLDGAFNKNVYQSSIDSFVSMNLITPAKVLPKSYWSFYEEKNKSPPHLLDILQSGLLYGFDYNSQNKSRYPRSNDKFREYFSNIKELQAFGIRLDSSSESSCLRDVTFTSEGWFGRLNLPPLIVDDSTGRKLWNLIAYEMCPDYCNSEFGVISYLSFLYSLIDSEEDLQQLRSARILRNRLSSDARILQLFHEMSSNFVSDHVYRHVEDAIESHFNKIKSNWKIRVTFQIVNYFRKYPTILTSLFVLFGLIYLKHF